MKMSTANQRSRDLSRPVRMWLVLAAVILLSAAFVCPVSAATMKGYTISAKKTALYKNNKLKKRKAWISPNTELTISSAGKTYVKISCKQKGKKLTGYMKNKDLFGGTSYDRKYASKKLTAYRKAKAGKTYGSVSKGAEILIVGSKGNFFRVIYRSGGGLRLGWIRKTDMENKALSEVMAADAGIKTKTVGTPSQVSGLTSLTGSSKKNLSGVYTIRTSDSSLFVLDIHENSLQNGGNLEICKSKSNFKNNNQEFRLTYLAEDGCYSIQNCESDLFLDVNMDTGNVTQWEWNGGDNQRWYVVWLGSSKVYLRNKYNGQYLDNSGGTLKDGNNVITYPFHGESNQVWQFKKAAEPGYKNIVQTYYYLVSAQNSDFVMDVYAPGGYGLHKFDNVQLYQNNGGLNQKFWIGYSADGYYTIRAQSSPFYVTVCLTEENIRNHISDNTLKLYQNPSEDGLFKFIPAGNGYYYIRSKYNGCYIDNSGGNVKNENDLITYQFTGGVNQKWKLVRTSL